MGGHGTSVQWRNRFLHEYLSVGTYFNDHSQAWEDGRNTTQKCGGAMPRGPAGQVKNCVESAGIGDGNCYYVDSTHSNSWRALRIIDGKRNLQYIEYDPTWKFKATDATGSGLQHYELYDIATDPYQMNNIYGKTDTATRTELHTSLSHYYNCKGTTDEPSTCRDADRGGSTTPMQLVTFV